MDKKCRDCKEIKPFSEFYKKKESKDKLTYECKKCWCKKTKILREKNPEKIKETNKKQYIKNREIRIKKQKEWSLNNSDKILQAKKRRLEKNPEYNHRFTIKKHKITIEYFNKMWIGQFGKCWICSTKFNKKSDAKIDHCHTKNIVRGLLCSSCNTALGLVKENETTLKIMIEYIKSCQDGWKEF